MSECPEGSVPKKLNNSLLDTEWSLFDPELKQGSLTHLRYDHVSHTLHAQKTKTDETTEDELQSEFYSQFPLTDITDVLRFVNTA